MPKSWNEPKRKKNAAVKSRTSKTARAFLKIFNERVSLTPKEKLCRSPK